MDKSSKTVFLLILALVLSVAVFVFTFSMSGVHYAFRVSPKEPFHMDYMEDDFNMPMDSSETPRNYQRFGDLPTPVSDEDDAVYLNASVCQVDEDCVPLPSECHPRQCINVQFQDQFDKPEVCTEIFDEKAAYKPEDCLCNRQEKVCFNKNSQIK